MVWSVYLIACYMLGTVLTAEWVSRLLYDGEIRKKGSRNPGARNMGRVYGRTAFILTLLGDAIKGMIAVGVGYYLTLPLFLVIVGLACVMIGHIAPFYRNWQGGEAVATFLGGITMLSPYYLLAFLIVALCSVLMRASITVAGWLGFIAVPLAAYIHTGDGGMAMAMTSLLLLLIWANRREK